MVQSSRRVLKRDRKLSRVQRGDLIQPGAHGGVEFYLILRGHHKPVASQTLPERSQPVDILHRVAMVIAEPHCSGDAHPCCLEATEKLVRPGNSAKDQSAVHSSA